MTKILRILFSLKPKNSKTKEITKGSTLIFFYNKYNDCSIVSCLCYIKVGTKTHCLYIGHYHKNKKEWNSSAFFLKLICVGLFLNPEKLNMMMFFYSKTVIIYVQLSQKKYTYSCMLYFVGKTGVAVQGILTSNAFSFNLKICIYIYVEHKYPERRTI